MTAAVVPFPDEEEILAAERQRAAMIVEVQRGLIPQPRSLAPWLFYDERGSRLFDRITHLPEYYLTRTERAILTGYADAMIRTARGASEKPLRLVELGAGNASKTGLLLDAAVKAQGKVEYVPIDVSSTALHDACASIAATQTNVTVTPVLANYVSETIDLAPYDGPTLVLYIGSSIGNFLPDDQRSILRRLRKNLHFHDSLLLGVDLVKRESTLMAAYDDADGVTEAFNLNLLSRLNRELGANFDLACYKHRVVWNKEASRMEMYLECRQPQFVRIPAAHLSVALNKGERIHTENSYKFTPKMLKTLLRDSGFEEEAVWMDEKSWFAVSLSHVG